MIQVKYGAAIFDNLNDPALVRYKLWLNLFFVVGAVHSMQKLHVAVK